MSVCKGVNKRKTCLSTCYHDGKDIPLLFTLAAKIFYEVFFFFADLSKSDSIFFNFSEGVLNGLIPTTLISMPPI